jgi:hypothetical protein
MRYLNEDLHRAGLLGTLAQETPTDLLRSHNTLVLRASRLGFESSLGPDRLPALARGIVAHGLRLRQAHAAAQAHRVATTPVLLAPFLVTSFAVDIQTGRRNEVKAMVPNCSCL